MFLSLEVVSYQQVLKTLQFMQGWSLGFVFVVGNDDGDLDANLCSFGFANLCVTIFFGSMHFQQ